MNDRPRRGPKGWRRLVLMASLLLAGVIAAGSFAHAGGKHHGFGSGPDGRGSRRGEAMMKQRADYALRSVDATPQQRAEIDAIISNAASDLAPVRASLGSARGEFATIIAAGEIDRGAAERLRAERVEAMDQASKRILTAALDAAEVLTPEQRSQLKARFEARSRG